MKSKKVHIKKALKNKGLTFVPDMILLNYTKEKNTMSKVKQYYTNEVEKAVDNITDDYIMNVIDYANAKEKLEKVENLELVMYKENIDDHLYYAKESK